MQDSIRSRWLTRSSRARLLAAAVLTGGLLVAGSSVSSASSAASAGTAATAGSSTATGEGMIVNVLDDPHQFRVAYGIQPLLDSGIDGRGETVTILAPAPPANASAPAATDIRQDLKEFDSVFGLPAARIEVVTSLAGSASPWRTDGEEPGDFEILHAVAPAATLRVVMFPSSWSQSAANATADMLAGLRLAVSHTDVVSISWSLGEHYFTKAQVAEMHSILLGAAAHHVTVIGSSGDGGSFPTPQGWGGQVKEVSLPASDPLVLAVGGTNLTANISTGAYIGETAWIGSGGGFSHLYARPAYQDGVPGISKTRGVPDVAGDADATISLSGTSASAPLWGGIVALADQYAHHDLGSVNSAIYRIGRSSSYQTAFHDVTTGNNGYNATPGWDPVTGWGTPNAQVLIPLLASFASPSET
jgi:subtilase family serine protease